MNRSETINELAAALVKVQAEMQPAAKNKQNPFFKSMYADHVAVMAASRPLLTKNGLCITQALGLLEGKPVLETTLIHQSGQWKSSVLLLAPAKNDAQSFGSYLSYMRRYAEMAIIGLAAEDDDGESAMDRTKGDAREKKKTETTPLKDQKKITPAQAQRLFTIAKTARWPQNELKAFIESKTGQTSTKDIPWTLYNEICEFIEGHPYP